MAMKDQTDYFGMTYFLTILGYYIKNLFMYLTKKTERNINVHSLLISEFTNKNELNKEFNRCSINRKYKEKFIRHCISYVKTNFIRSLDLLQIM